MYSKYILNEYKQTMENIKTITTNDNRTQKYNYRKGSRPGQIYELHFLQKKTIEEIAASTSFKIKEIEQTISYINNRLNSNGTEITPEVPTIENPHTKALIVRIFERGDDILLYVKTCKEFEDYLIRTKVPHESNNLWNQRKSGKFYQFKIVGNYLDDVNLPIVKDGKINFGVLRIPGISEGIEYKIDGLLTEKQLEVAVQKLVNAFNKFYKVKIICQTIDIAGEVQIEEDTQNDNTN
jgi:hypothetical protein